MHPPTKRSKILIRRFAISTLIKLSYFACLGSIVLLLLFFGVIAAVAPDRVKVAPGFTGWNLVGTLLSFLILWPLISGLALACGAWVVLKVVSLFTNTEIEVVQDASSPES